MEPKVATCHKEGERFYNKNHSAKSKSNNNESRIKYAQEITGAKIGMPQGHSMLNCDVNYG